VRITQNVNILCSQNVFCFNVKPGGRQSNSWLNIQRSDSAKFILLIILQETSNSCLGLPYYWERQDKRIVVLNRKRLVEREYKMCLDFKRHAIKTG